MTMPTQSLKPRNLKQVGVITAIATTTLLVILGSLLLLNFRSLIKWQVEQNINASIMSQDISASRFEVVFCGTGAPHHSADRGQPCLGVIAGGQLLVFDAGENAAGHLNEAAAPLEKLDAIFITHLHSDHIAGLGETLHNGWLFGREKSVEVIGPPGTARLLEGFKNVYAADIKERSEITEAQYQNKFSELGHAREWKIDNDDAVIVYNRNEIIVRAFRVIHPTWEYAYGYKIEFGGKSIVLSGDTRYTSAIGRHGKNTDLLIHEALHVELMTIAGEVLSENANGTVHPNRIERIKARHTPTLDVAQAAADANAKTLIITHLTPAIPAIGLLERYFIHGMDEIFDGEIIVARDAMRYVLLD